MSSSPGSPKKNRMRSLLANSFRRPRSQSHSHSSSVPNEGARLGSAQSGTPSAINAAVSLSSAGPNIPSTSEPDSAKLGRARGKAALAGFRTSLEVLRDNAGVFPPLSSAAGILLSCIEGIETAGRNQQEYENLWIELTRSAEFLSQRMQGAGSLPVSNSFLNISKSIEQQAQEIETKLAKKTGGRVRKTIIEEEEILGQYRRVESLFRQLQTDASMSIWSIVNSQLVETRLQGLESVKEATYDSGLSNEVGRRTCTEGTRIRVLEDLRDWINDPMSAPIYWMNGMAGIGKTTIACTFCEQMEGRKLLAASFFCTRNFPDCRRVNRIIPTIAYQLARYSLPFKTALCHVLDQDPDIAKKTLSKQFDKLLKEPLAGMEGVLPQNLVVVIDALDECENGTEVERILDTLFRYATGVPLKFLVTSRPEPEIYPRIMQHNDQSRVVVHLHEIEKSLVQTDIKLFLEEELSLIALTPPQLEQLLERSGALFIYAATLVRYIQSGEKRANLHKRLKSVLELAPDASKRHAHLDALYKEVLKSAFDEEEAEEDEQEDVREVLRTVLVAREPISVETIASLTGIDDPQRVVSALQPLRSVIHQSEQTKLVSILHASFPDFMFSNDRSGSYFFDQLEYNQRLASRCFSAMETQLRFNICHLDSSFLEDNELEDLEARIKAHISSTLVYTCRHWGAHLDLAPRSEYLLKALADFFSNRFLFWMEVLNLRQEMNIGSETLVKAKDWLTASPAEPQS
ncbi:unnamed protein product [Rhizoctonia solani]|uniref:NACHT domain-containing protein n=1 Tax=Rhizoctonia solani TaxID=456999 RepID=A0A8H3GF14_9AGAM|nr:unnamed protein product [Rhizoctonia solani]